MCVYVCVCAATCRKSYFTNDLSLMLKVLECVRAKRPFAIADTPLHEASSCRECIPNSISIKCDTLGVMPKLLTSEWLLFLQFHRRHSIPQKTIKSLLFFRMFDDAAATVRYFTLNCKANSPNISTFLSKQYFHSSFVCFSVGRLAHTHTLPRSAPSAALRNRNILDAVTDYCFSVRLQSKLEKKGKGKANFQKAFIKTFNYWLTPQRLECGGCLVQRICVRRFQVALANGAEKGIVEYLGGKIIASLAWRAVHFDFGNETIVIIEHDRDAPEIVDEKLSMSS